MKIPEPLFYTSEHLWVSQNEDQNWLAGITDYAQDLLGDVVFIDPPKLQQRLVMNTTCGMVESVKTGSDLHAPLNGIVTEVNEAILGAPETLNDKPYEAWIFKFKPDDVKDIALLMSAAQYKAHITA